MAKYEKQVRDILAQNGCCFVRRGKGDHDIWHSPITKRRTEEELQSLSRIVNAYLDIAEDMAQRKIPMAMEDWEKRLNIFLLAADREVLPDAGKITHEIAVAHAESGFEKYRVVQDRLFRSDFDKFLEVLPKEIAGDGQE
jgi:hypothetical protein